MAIGTTIPPRPASTGSATRRRWRSSPTSNSRRASRPTTKKKNVIRPAFTQWRRSCATLEPPTRIVSRVCHTVSYDDVWTFTHTSAATVAASRNAALPVSVRMNSRTGDLRFRAHAVRPENGPAASSAALKTLLLLLVALDDLRRAHRRRLRVVARLPQRAPLAQQVPALVERDLHALEAPAVLVGRRTCCLPLAQLVLLGDELLDRPVNLTVVHVAHPFVGVLMI